MFPTPPSLEQHPAFSPIMTYRDTPSQEPPASGAMAADHLPPLASTQLADNRMETEEGVASPRQEDIKVRPLPADLRLVLPTQISPFPSSESLQLLGRPRRNSPLGSSTAGDVSDVPPLYL